MIFLESHAFCDDGFGMIWDTKHLCWIKPNANEQKRAIGFHINSNLFLVCQMPLNINFLVKSWI